jgi:hypothetical protein
MPKAQPLLLDLFPNAAVAYSLRKLRTAYTGSAIRVRRSSDNAEQNISFVGNNLDTASLLTFCGVGNGFIVTWYDQSGNTRHLVQPSGVNQPKIVSSGALETVNSKPIITFDGLNDSLNHTITLAQPLNLFLAATATTIPIGNTYRNIVSMPNSAGTDAGIEIDISSPLTQKTLLYSGVIIGDTTVRSGNMIVSGLSNGASSTLHINGNSIASGNAGTSNIGIIRLGANFNFTNYNNGKYFEFILYPTNQSTNRAAIETNINTFYSIY